MIPVTKPFLPPKIDYDTLLDGVWKRQWLTNMGPLSNQLEISLKSHLNVKHLLFVTNGTIALQLAIKVLGLTGEVITTPFSYVATSSSIFWEGCKPVFVDIDKNSLNIDPEKIEAAITKKTTAILATHVYGNPCDVEAIQSIADKNGLKIIYDAAHSFGVKVNGAGTINFNNSMRRVDNNNTLRTSAIDDKLWLSVKANGFERGSQTLIAFSENTTQAWDAGYDSRRMATVVSLYSHLGEGQGELGIQSLNAFSAQQKVSLGFSSLITEDLEYTLQLDEAIGESMDGTSSSFDFNSIHNSITILHCNIRSPNANVGELQYRANTFKPTLLALNETWLDSSHPDVLMVTR